MERVEEGVCSESAIYQANLDRRGLDEANSGEEMDGEAVYMRWGKEERLMKGVKESCMCLSQSKAQQRAQEAQADEVRAVARAALVATRFRLQILKA